MSRYTILFFWFLLCGFSWPMDGTKPNVFFMGDSITGRPTEYNSLLKHIASDQVLNVLPSDIDVYEHWAGGYLAGWDSKTSALCGEADGYKYLWQCLEDTAATVTQLDYIVIALLYNDMVFLFDDESGTPGNGDADEWIAAYKTFIGKIQTDYPTAQIVQLWYYPVGSSFGDPNGGKVIVTSGTTYAHVNENANYVINQMAPWFAAQSIPVIDFFHYSLKTYGGGTNPDTYLALADDDEWHVHINDYNIYGGYVMEKMRTITGYNKKLAHGTTIGHGVVLK